MSKQEGDFFQILWPSHNVLTLKWFLRRSQKIDKISKFIWNLIIKSQINLENLLHCLAFLENMKLYQKGDRSINRSNGDFFTLLQKWTITSSKRISTSKCDICILKLILTLFVLQNSWHFWRKSRIYFIWNFLDFFGILFEFFGNITQYGHRQS